MTRLTPSRARPTEIAPGMRYTDWLRHQVSRLEEEIRVHSVFDTDTPATPEELKGLRTRIVIHRYLKQQLLRRETTVDVEEYDTQEFVLVRRA